MSLPIEMWFWKKSKRRVHHLRSMKVKYIKRKNINMLTLSPFQGAIFIHQGQSYLVEECNVDQRYAKVHLARVDWTTQQRDYTNVNAIQTVMRKPISSDSDSDGVKNFVGFGKVQSKYCKHDGNDKPSYS